RAARLGVELLPMEAVLERADVLTLHLPLTPRTRHIIGPAQFARMRPGIRIVNCARGGLIDEGALLAELEEGRVASAALDVFEQEPPGESPLVRHPRVIATPHLGASTEEAQRGIGIEVAEQVIAALACWHPSWTSRSTRSMRRSWRKNAALVSATSAGITAKTSAA